MCWCLGIFLHSIVHHFTIHIATVHTFFSFSYTLAMYVSNPLGICLNWFWRIVSNGTRVVFPHSLTLSLDLSVCLSLGTFFELRIFKHNILTCSLRLLYRLKMGIMEHETQWGVRKTMKSGHYYYSSFIHSFIHSLFVL